MNAYSAHLLNACTLVLMGGWGYFATNSPTSFVPIVIGIVLLSLTNGVKNGNKAIAHVAVILTLLGLIGLAMKPLMGALNSDDLMKKIRVISMVSTSVIAIIYFVKSFIDAAKARRANRGNA